MTAPPYPAVATVIGASGFVGRNIVQELARRGTRVIATAQAVKNVRRLLPLGDPGQITAIPLKAKLPPEQNPFLVQALKQSELVINCVGILHASARGFNAIHAVFPARVASLAAKHGVRRFVHISALGAEPNSRSKYARSKALGEAKVLEAFPSAIVARPSVVFGEEDQFVQRFAAAVRDAPVFPLIGNGTTRFQPVSVADLARAVVALGAEPVDALPPSVFGARLDFSGADAITLRELLEQIIQLTGRNCKLIPVPFRVARALALPLTLLPKPPLTPDQVVLLQHNNAAPAHTDGFASLNLEADGISFHIERLLGRTAKPYSQAWKHRVA